MGESHWQTISVVPSATKSDGVTAHFQTRTPSEKSSSTRTTANAHLFHGFGANLWSWQDVHQPLADYFRGTVAAHDQAGFGLTFRPDEAEECALLDPILDLFLLFHS